MTAIVAGVLVVLVRLGIPRNAAFVSSLLFITAGTAAPGWTRLTMAEPLGTLLFLGATFIACGYGESSAWKPRSIAIAGLLAAAVLTKEMFIGVAPFVILLAWRQSSGFSRARASDHRMPWLLLSTALGLTIVALPIVALAIQAPPDAFAGLYGDAAPKASHFILNLALFSLPASPVLLPQNLQTFLLTNYLFLVILGLGCWQAIRAREVYRPWLTVGGIALTLPIAAAALYVPWPQVQPFYGLPYLLGPCILLGYALALTERSPVVTVWLGRMACAIVLLSTAATSQRLATMSFAQRRHQFEIARRVAESRDVNSLLYAIRKRPPVAWEGTGPTLGRYAQTVFKSARLASGDVLCDEMRAFLASPRPRALVISVSYECGSLPSPQYVLVERYTYLGWPILRPRRDSIRADFWMSPGQEAGGKER
jgi:hypothetical protein